jgi:hypothetical protein
VIDLKDMETNWTVLKKKLDEQLEDIKKHSGSSGNWGVCRKCYLGVKKLMEYVEHGEEDQLKAWNGGWHTEEEIEEILKN